MLKNIGGFLTPYTLYTWSLHIRKFLQFAGFYVHPCLWKTDQNVVHILWLDDHYFRLLSSSTLKPRKLQQPYTIQNTLIYLAMFMPFCWGERSAKAFTAFSKETIAPKWQKPILFFKTTFYFKENKDSGFRALCPNMRMQGSPHPQLCSTVFSSCYIWAAQLSD